MPSNNSVTSSVNVTVEQTPTGVIVSPSSATVATGGTQQFSATATDQFNNPISSPTFTWSITGTSDGNSIDGTGLATLGSTPGTFTVMATLGSASNTAQVSADVAPTVSSFQVNDGNAQRSMVDSLTVTFNESVTLADNAITLNLLSQTGGSPTPMSFTLSGSGTTYVLTFTGSDYVGNSLPDGAYELIVSAGGVSGTGNLNMSADQDYEFFRLYGDFNGDGKVDSADFGVLAIDYGTADEFERLVSGLQRRRRDRQRRFRSFRGSLRGIDIDSVGSERDAAGRGDEQRLRHPHPRPT